MKTLVSSALALALTFGAALAQTPAPAATGQTAKGEALVNDKRMTLYTFDRDAPAKSNCNGQCATNWPPLAAPASAQATGEWSVVTRDDGSKQWAYKGKPLYAWVNDKQPGDTTGDGVQSVWHIAKP